MPLFSGCFSRKKKRRKLKISAPLHLLVKVRKRWLVAPGGRLGGSLRPEWLDDVRGRLERWKLAPVAVGAGR